MNHSEKKSKNFPVPGICFICMISVDIVLLCCTEIFQAVGGIVFDIYDWISSIWLILHFIPGLLLFPVLLVIFIVQLIRFRGNKLYVRNCILSLLVSILLAASGYIGKRWIFPVVAGGITTVKLNDYERIVTDIHAGEKNDQYLMGGTEGHEDIAFFQYRAYEKKWFDEENVSKTQDIYLLYSEDEQCELKDELRLPQYSYCHIELKPLKENWYEMVVENIFAP